jgi:hypothetical protein
VYEVFSTSFYALTPNDSEEVELQKILWSPASYDSSNTVNSNNNIIRQKKVLPNSKSKAKAIEKSKISQAIAFIHDHDIYYKPKIHSDLVIRVTTNGELVSFERDKRDERRASRRLFYLLIQLRSLVGSATCKKLFSLTMSGECLITSLVGHQTFSN